MSGRRHRGPRDVIYTGDPRQLDGLTEGDRNAVLGFAEYLKGLGPKKNDRTEGDGEDGERPDGGTGQ